LACFDYLFTTISQSKIIEKRIFIKESLFRFLKVESDALLSCRDLIVRLSPSYKVVRLELADLAFISRAYNPSSSLKPLISLPGRPTYADVVRGRAAPATH
jgi:hypothetical protein